jgi:hypothetical protein
MQKFRDVLRRWNGGDLSMLEAGELLGMSERQFRRYRDRYEEAGEAGLLDRRLGKLSTRRVPAEAIEEMLELSSSLPWLEREAFPRAPAARSRFQLGLHLHQDTASCGWAGGTGQAAWSSPAASRVNRFDAKLKRTDRVLPNRTT